MDFFGFPIPFPENPEDISEKLQTRKAKLILARKGQVDNVNLRALFGRDPIKFDAEFKVFSDTINNQVSYWQNSMIGLGEKKCFFVVWVGTTVIFEDSITNLHNLRSLAQEYAVPAADESTVQQLRRERKQTRFSVEYQRQRTALLNKVNGYITDLENGKGSETLFEKRVRKSMRSPEAIQAATNREIDRLQRMRLRVAKYPAVPPPVLRRTNAAPQKPYYRDLEGPALARFWESKMHDSIILSWFEYAQHDFDVLAAMDADVEVSDFIIGWMIETADNLWKLFLVHENEEEVNKHVADVNLRTRSMAKGREKAVQSSFKSYAARWEAAHAGHQIADIDKWLIYLACVE